MKINQNVIVENRDFMGQVTGTIEGIFMGYDDSDMMIALNSGKTIYVKESQVFESIEEYKKIVANRNNNPLKLKKIENYDWFEK
jgi:uncharacterized protein YlzI (FlbEa/FlbD family)